MFRVFKWLNIIDNLCLVFDKCRVCLLKLFMFSKCVCSLFCFFIITTHAPFQLNFGPGWTQNDPRPGPTAAPSSKGPHPTSLHRPDHAGRPAWLPSPPRANVCKLPHVLLRICSPGSIPRATPAGPHGAWLVPLVPNCSSVPSPSPDVPMLCQPTNMAAYWPLFLPRSPHVHGLLSRA